MKLKEALKSPASDIPRVEFIGREAACIEGCESILEYRPETVKLRFRGYCLRLIGDGLLLSDLRKGSLVVTGSIYTVDFNG